jgi:K+-sensing histidine kinase KdpD
MAEDSAKTDKRDRVMPDWLLGCLLKVLGHDLPNQFVAANGLLRLLQSEEGERLGEDGKDYLRRACATLERSQALVTGLADIVRAARGAEPSQSLLLAEVVGEAAAQGRRVFAGHPIAIQSDILVPILEAPPQSFRQVLALLLRRAIQSSQEGVSQVTIRAEPATDGVEIRLTWQGPPLFRGGQQPTFDPLADAVGDGPDWLALVLAKTLAKQWGGDLHIGTGTEQSNSIIIRVPAAQEGHANSSRGMPRRP